MEEDGMSDELPSWANDEAMRELDIMFLKFLEKEINDPNSKISRKCDEIDSRNIISDLNAKLVKQIAGKDSISPEEAWFLSNMAGRDDDGGHPFADMYYDDDCGATSEQLEKYADYLRNYMYTYRDEARDIDPSIDPEEEHVGPMAQDIEKVAPDCVKETPEGVKTVDGERLALVNAGIIGELARRVMELEAKINGRG